MQAAAMSFVMNAPGDLQRYLTELVLDNQAIPKITAGIRLIERHLKKIFANSGKLSVERLVQCRALQSIELANMKMAVKVMQNRQMSFVKFMMGKFSRPKQFIMAQNPALSEWASTLTSEDMQFLVSLLPILSTTASIRRDFCIKIRPMLVHQVRDVRIETFDMCKGIYWDEEQECTIQILRVPMDNGLFGYRMLIWDQICKGFKEIRYNHDMYGNMGFWLESGGDAPPGKSMQFRAVDGPNLQNAKTIHYTHFCYFKTKEACIEFVHVGRYVINDMQKVERKLVQRKEKFRRLRPFKKLREQQEMGNGELNNNNNTTEASRNEKKLQKQKASLKAIMTSFYEFYKLQNKNKQLMAVHVNPIAPQKSSSTSASAAAVVNNQVKDTNKTSASATPSGIGQKRPIRRTDC